MAEIPKVHRVNSEQIKTGTAIEQAEHPWASKTTARKIAEDHLRQNPQEYKAGNKTGSHGGGGTIVIINEKVHISSTPKKKKPPVPLQQAPAWQTWGSELL
jgi:hypothetical protein